MHQPAWEKGSQDVPASSLQLQRSHQGCHTLTFRRKPWMENKPCAQPGAELDSEHPVLLQALCCHQECAKKGHW